MAVHRVCSRTVSPDNKDRHEGLDGKCQAYDQDNEPHNKAVRPNNCEFQSVVVILQQGRAFAAVRDAVELDELDNPADDSGDLPAVRLRLLQQGLRVLRGQGGLMCVTS